MKKPIIRPILKKDNPHIAKVIRNILIDFGVPKVGTAYADKTLDALYEAYQKPRSIYFVIELNGNVIGGGGIAKLENCDENICELQKMYFLEEVRGLGLGNQMINLCFQKAKDFMFEKCYLETMTYMEAAQKLYLKNDFKYIDGPMGNTGHYSCPVHMLKEL
jgi:putative acetyltransferase